MTEPQATAPKAEPQKEKVGIGAYIALALAVILFSGVFYKMPAGKEWLGAVDFTTGVMLALGLIEVLAHYGALRAAQVLMTPLLKPILGVPGYTGLALVTDFQSTDGGAALTRALYDEKRVTRKQLITICAWQYAGAGCINNYYSTVSALFPMFLCPVWIPVIIIICLKFVGGALIRTVLSTVYKKDFENDN